MPAFACSVILAGAALGGVWWSERKNVDATLDEARAAYGHQDWPAAVDSPAPTAEKPTRSVRLASSLAGPFTARAATRPRQPSWKGCPQTTWEAEDFFCRVRHPFAPITFPCAIEYWQKGNPSSTRTTLNYD